jgi:hypothetical protein
MQLSDYIGQQIVVFLPDIDPEHFEWVKLLGVEAGGIWIESQTLINKSLALTGRPTAPKSLAFFFPYHQLRYLFVSAEGPALNEAAFGV